MAAFNHPPASDMHKAPHPLEKINAELRAKLAAAERERDAMQELLESLSPGISALASGATP